jgi:hypothetical protein
MAVANLVAGPSTIAASPALSTSARQTCRSVTAPSHPEARESFKTVLWLPWMSSSRMSRYVHHLRRDVRRSVSFSRCLPCHKQRVIPRVQRVWPWRHSEHSGPRTRLPQLASGEPPEGPPVARDDDIVHDRLLVTPLEQDWPEVQRGRIRFGDEKVPVLIPAECALHRELHCMRIRDGLRTSSGSRRRCRLRPGCSCCTGSRAPT